MLSRESSIRKKSHIHEKERSLCAWKEQFNVCYVGTVMNGLFRTDQVHDLNKNISLFVFLYKNRWNFCSRWKSTIYPSSIVLKAVKRAQIGIGSVLLSAIRFISLLLNRWKWLHDNLPNSISPNTNLPNALWSFRSIIRLQISSRYYKDDLKYLWTI